MGRPYIGRLRPRYDRGRRKADIQLFDERWMKDGDLSARLGFWASGLKDRQGWNVWGVGDDTIAMVRMFESTHGRNLESTNGRKYLD